MTSRLLAAALLGASSVIVTATNSCPLYYDVLRAAVPAGECDGDAGRALLRTLTSQRSSPTQLSLCPPGFDCRTMGDGDVKGRCVPEKPSVATLLATWKKPCGTDADCSKGARFASSRLYAALQCGEVLEGGALVSRCSHAPGSLAAADLCEYDEECESRACVNGYCAARGAAPADRACSGDAQCAAGLVCMGTTRVCGAPGTGAEFLCTRDAECASGYCDVTTRPPSPVGDKRGTCAAPRTEGQSCESTCAAGLYCAKASRVCRRPIATGSACDADDAVHQCADAHARCISDRCTALFTLATGTAFRVGGGERNYAKFCTSRLATCVREGPDDLACTCAERFLQGSCAPNGTAPDGYSCLCKMDGSATEAQAGVLVPMLADQGEGVHEVPPAAAYVDDDTSGFEWATVEVDVPSEMRRLVRELTPGVFCDKLVKKLAQHTWGPRDGDLNELVAPPALAAVLKDTEEQYRRFSYNDAAQLRRCRDMAADYVAYRSPSGHGVFQPATPKSDSDGKAWVKVLVVALVLVAVGGVCFVVGRRTMRARAGALPGVALREGAGAGSGGAYRPPALDAEGGYRQF